MGYYFGVLLLSMLMNRSVWIRLMISAACTAGVILSAYLAYIMAIKLSGTICVVCLVSYAINIALYIVSVIPLLPLLSSEGKLKTKQW